MATTIRSTIPVSGSPFVFVPWMDPSSSTAVLVWSVPTVPAALRAARTLFLPELQQQQLLLLLPLGSSLRAVRWRRGRPALKQTRILESSCVPRKNSRRKYIVDICAHHMMMGSIHHACAYRMTNVYKWVYLRTFLQSPELMRNEHTHKHPPIIRPSAGSNSKLLERVTGPADEGGWPSIVLEGHIPQYPPHINTPGTNNTDRLEHDVGPYPYRWS